MFELTAFQRDLMYVAAGLDQPSGQQIKSELEEVLDEITHGRLYPNLDSLTEKGYLEQGEIDRRTNYYELTDSGRNALYDRREWEERYVDFPSQ